MVNRRTFAYYFGKPIYLVHILLLFIFGRISIILHQVNIRYKL